MRLPYRRDHDTPDRHAHPRRCPAAAGRPARGCASHPRRHARHCGAGVRLDGAAHGRGADRGPGGPGAGRHDRPRHHAVPARHHPGPRRARRARVRRQQGLGRRRRPRARRPRVRRARLVGARVRRQRRADRAGLPGPRGRRRPRARRLAGRPSRGRAGRPGRPSGRRHRRVLRRGARAAARGLRPAGRRAGTGDHLERPGPGPVPERRRCPGSPPADTPARGAFAPDGVFKRGWAGVFFSAGLAPGGGPRGAAEGATAPAGGERPVGRHRYGRQRSEDGADEQTSAARARRRRAGRRGLRRIDRGTDRRTVPGGGVPTTCGRFTPAVCAAYTEAATTGRLSPATAELLRRSSPASVTDRITAPTLIVQGEQDTLFGLDQADANARQIAAAGGTVRMLWFAGGHDGGAPDQRVRDAVGEWFDHWLARDGDDPGTDFGYAVESGVRTGGDTPDQPHRRGAGLPGARRDTRGVHAAAPARGRPAGRAGPAGRQPGRDHLAARARRRAGQRRRPGGRVHRRAARAVGPVPHRSRRRPAAGRRRSAGRPHGRPGAGPARRRRTRPCCSARSTRSPRTGCGRCWAAPSPRSGSRARRRLRRARHGHAARRRRADRGRQPAGGLDQHHRPGLRGQHHPAAWRIGIADGPGGALACRSCPARPSRRTPCRSVRCSASPWCSPRRCSEVVARVRRRGVDRATTTSSPRERDRPRPRAIRHRPPAAGDPRPRQDLPGRVQRGEGRVVRRRAGHGARPARPQRRRARPPSCGC